ncbi:MAG TPA: RsmB/NOP family class I SAM-dependent RNA methyltransferase, partial [bacterium]|nr:RsmB/NOP family class I SAM-dependent RNA methyltransferase [bacterium]
RLLREQTEIAAKLADGRLEAYPEWMLRRWRKRYPKDKLRGMLEYFAAPAPLWARINQLKPAEADGPPGGNLIELGSYDRGQWLKWMESGRISIQDRHSYQVALSIEPMKGEQILDACAGHGGKSSAMVEAAPGCKLFVHDVSKERLLQLGQNFSRLGLPQPETLTDLRGAVDRGLTFDAILIDAPCSGMGTLGRKPEIRWRLKPADLGRLAAKQRAILEEWLPLLKVGGRAIYAVCSLEPEEGRENLAAFLAEHSAFHLEEERELFPGPGAGDGFYVARLARRK